MTEVIEDAVDHLGLRDERNDAHGFARSGDILRMAYQTPKGRDRLY